MLDVEQLARFEEIKQTIEEDQQRREKLTKAKCVYKGSNIIVRKNDITDEPVDAIVNPANEHLTNGAGAARAIDSAAGYEYRRQLNLYLQDHGYLPTGEILVTTGGDLLCGYVINVVGPC